MGLGQATLAELEQRKPQATLAELEQRKPQATLAELEQQVTHRSVTREVAHT
jgi:hypothetical protein